MADAFIVAYDGGLGVCIPYGWDVNCEGALSTSQHYAAMFDSIESARKAIDISHAYARLCRAQGKPAATDFTENLNRVKIFRWVFEFGRKDGE